MINLDATLISIFANARQPMPRDVPVSVTQFLDAIQRGDYAHKVAQARALRQQYKAGAIDKSAYQEYKARQLEAVTIAGVFEGRPQSHQSAAP